MEEEEEADEEVDAGSVEEKYINSRKTSKNQDNETIIKDKEIDFQKNSRTSGSASSRLKTDILGTIHHRPIKSIKQ